ncbi:MAG: hypothetical protein OEZ58_07920 [Gammaproteobacteria bacterium]|nr:hypothetical protein [Gammaproteobacteria bacterium]MDH5728903.1 hypothetical protein [Gammaproteobacteria bacterium]
MNHQHWILSWTIRDENGDVLHQQPATQVSADNLKFPAPVCSALQQATVSDELNIVCSAADAYGEFEQAKIQALARSEFPSDMTLVPGTIVSFTAQSGMELAATVVDLNDDFVEVDFNHPWAGKILTYQLQIQAIGQGEN